MDLKFKQIERRVSLSLEVPFFKEEIRDAIWECDDSIALGPMDFFFSFKKCWNVIHENLVKMMVDFHMSGKLEKALIHLLLR